MTAPYSITLNGSESTWTAGTLDEIMKQWEALGPIAGLTLWFGEKRVTTLLETFVRPETQKGPSPKTGA
jgi:hypothetical protein